MEKRKIGCDSRLGGTENRRANFRYHRPCSGCRIQRYRHRTIRNRPVRTRFGEITAGPQILVDGGCNNYARGGQLESDQFRQPTTRRFLAGAFSGELAIRRRRADSGARMVGPLKNQTHLAIHPFGLMTSFTPLPSPESTIATATSSSV